MWVIGLEQVDSSRDNSWFLLRIRVTISGVRCGLSVAGDALVEICRELGFFLLYQFQTFSTS